MNVQASKKTLTVFGSRYPQEGSAEYELARSLGRLLAKNGWTICTGGYSGIMEAVSRGAREEKGHTIGITVRAFSGAANPYVVEEIRTESLFARLEQLMDRGQAYVVFRGGMGTIAELTLAWNLIQMGQMDGPRPLLLFGKFWGRILETWKQETDISPHDYEILKVVSSPEEVLAVLNSSH